MAPIGPRRAGEVFRAKVDEPRLAIDLLTPNVGAVVGVEFEPGSRKVRFDQDDPALSQKAARSARADSFDAALAQPPGARAEDRT